MGGGQGQSGQAIKLFQAPRKTSFTFHFRHKFFIFEDAKTKKVKGQGRRSRKLVRMLLSVDASLSLSFYILGRKSHSLAASECVKPAELSNNSFE